jgi:uncharacterized membrane protein required for colicin V production
MSIADIIVPAIVVVTTAFGYRMGAVRQVFGLAGVAAGYALAMRLYLPASRHLAFRPGPARAIGFTAVFVACIVAAHVAGWIAGRYLGRKAGAASRVSGAVLGFSEAWLIVLTLTIAATAFLSPGNSLFRTSSVMRHILPLAAHLKKVPRADITATYNEKVGRERLPWQGDGRPPAMDVRPPLPDAKGLKPPQLPPEELTREKGPDKQGERDGVPPDTGREAQGDDEGHR